MPIFSRGLPFQLCLWGLNGVLFAVGIWLTTLWTPPRAQYPARPIDLVVPFGAGGGSDAYARIFKKAIDDNQLLPVPLVIQNRGGAGATIGSRYVRDAAPDGYTMLLLHDAMITAKYSGMVRYGPEAFEPVALTGELGMVIAVAAESDYGTLKELMTAAREEPGELSFAVNRGALTHVAGLQLEQAEPEAKFQFPQSGGGNDRLVDLLGGHVDATGFSLEEYLRYRDSEDGKTPQLRGLAYLGEERNSAAPEVPTALEQGYDVNLINRFYWWVPKGTPPERIAVLAEALQAALQTEYVKQQMAAAHCERIFRTGEDLKATLAETEDEIAQVEFTKPQGVPDMQRIVMIAVALLLVVWGMQTGDRRIQIATAVTLLLCLLMGSLIASVDGWSAFVVLAGIVLVARYLRPLLTERIALVSAGLTVGYVTCLTVGWGDFRWLTLGYILLIGGTLMQKNRLQFGVLTLIAQTLAFGLYGIFRFLFEVPLPT